MGTSAATGSMAGGAVGFDPPSVEREHVRAALALRDGAVREALCVQAGIRQVAGRELDLGGVAARVTTTERVGAADAFCSTKRMVTARPASGEKP